MLDIVIRVVKPNRPVQNKGKARAEQIANVTDNAPVVYFGEGNFPVVFARYQMTDTESWLL